ELAIKNEHLPVSLGSAIFAYVLLPGWFGLCCFRLRRDDFQHRGSNPLEGFFHVHERVAIVAQIPANSADHGAARVDSHAHAERSPVQPAHFIGQGCEPTLDREGGMSRCTNLSVTLLGQLQHQWTSKVSIRPGSRQSHQEWLSAPSSSRR